MSDVSAIPDFSVAAEGPADHIRNALMLLGGLRRAMQRFDVEGEDVAPLVEAISARLDKALKQVEARPHAS